MIRLFRLSARVSSCAVLFLAIGWSPAVWGQLWSMDFNQPPNNHGPIPASGVRCLDDNCYPGPYFAPSPPNAVSASTGYHYAEFTSSDIPPLGDAFDIIGAETTFLSPSNGGGLRSTSAWGRGQRGGAPNDHFLALGRAGYPGAITGFAPNSRANALVTKVNVGGDTLRVEFEVSLLDILHDGGGLFGLGFQVGNDYLATPHYVSAQNGTLSAGRLGVRAIPAGGNPRLPTAGKGGFALYWADAPDGTSFEPDVGPLPLPNEYQSSPIITEDVPLRVVWTLNAGAATDYEVPQAVADVFDVNTGTWRQFIGQETMDVFMFWTDPMGIDRKFQFLNDADFQTSGRLLEDFGLFGGDTNFSGVFGVDNIALHAGLSFNNMMPGGAFGGADDPFDGDFFPAFPEPSSFLLISMAAVFLGVRRNPARR